MLRAKPRSMRRRASDSRAWTVAQKLRARRGWLLEDAFFQRSWSVDLGAAAFETSAAVSLFFDGPGMVVALTPSFPKATRRTNSADALQHLLVLLGERYWISPLGDSVLTKVVSNKPKQLLSEIAHVEHVLGERAARRLGPSPRSQDHRRWYVVEALRASSWLLGSLGFSRHVGDQRALSARIGVLVETASGPGLSASFAGYVPRANEPWTQFRDATVLGLTAEGFRVDEKKPSFFSVTRWIAGLSASRALKQAGVFDELIDSGAAVIR